MRTQLELELRLNIKEAANEEKIEDVDSAHSDMRQSERQRELERTRQAEQEKYKTNEQLQRDTEQRNALYRQQNEYKINILRRGERSSSCMLISK